MKQVSLISQITSLLVQSSKEVKDNGKLKLNDINIISEDVFARILSIIFETELINLNIDKANFPGIDLLFLQMCESCNFFLKSCNNLLQKLPQLCCY
jgi:hypothetical protein